jgi:hypothetical protein
MVPVNYSDSFPELLVFLDLVGSLPPRGPGYAPQRNLKKTQLGEPRESPGSASRSGTAVQS